MASPIGAGASEPDSYRCPDCGELLSNIDGVGSCARCGFTAAHPLAGRLWQIDTELGRLGAERARVIWQMRQDRASTPLPVVATEFSPTPVRPQRHLSGQALLVGLGAFLLIVAGIVFAAVTWDRLGAAGQAAVLFVATAIAVAATLSAARAELTSTAEALSVVVAGFALIDVHAVRVAVTPEGDWQWVWSIGLVVLAAGLFALGKAASLRSPPMIGLVAVQLPLVLLTSILDDPGPAVGSALVVTAAVDEIGVHSLGRSSWPWFPDPARTLLRLLGAGTWICGVLITLPWAFGERASPDTEIDRWWGIAVLVIAAVSAAALARAGSSRDLLSVTAAGAATLSGLVTVLAVSNAVLDANDGLLLVANAAPVVVLGASLLATRHAAAGVDARVRASQITAGIWAILSLLGWFEPVAGSLIAPFWVLAENGWWNSPPGVTTSDLAISTDLIGTAYDRPATAVVLAAVLIGTAALVATLMAFTPSNEPIRRWGPRIVVGAGCFVAVAVAAVRWDVPITAPVAVYLLAAAALVLAAAWPGRPILPLVALGSLAPAVWAVAWAGSVDVLTIVALTVLTFVGIGAVVRGLAEDHRAWTLVATALTASALPTTALTAALGADSSDDTAWIAAVVAIAAASGVAWVADRWVRWWSTIVDMTTAVVASCTLVGLAIAGSPESFSVGLAIISITAAAHILRPSRRIIAAVIASAAALGVLWIQLWIADVRLVEAYSLPAAVLLGGAGWWQMRRDPTIGSWPALGPALLVAAVPSAFAAVVETGAVRPLAVLGVAVGVTVAGALLGLRAPLVVGSITTVIMAVDQLFPAAARLPRWVGIGALGVLLLVIGATFERQRRRMLTAYERYRTLR